MNFNLFVVLDRLFNFSIFDFFFFVYKLEAIIVFTSRVVLGLNELIDV